MMEKKVIEKRFSRTGYIGEIKVHGLEDTRLMREVSESEMIASFIEEYMRHENFGGIAMMTTENIDEMAENIRLFIRSLRDMKTGHYTVHA